MSEVEVKLFERRRKQFMIHKVGRDLRVEEKKLADEFGCDSVALTTDWSHRAEWLPDVLDVEDVCLLKDVVTGEFQRFIDECWSVIQENRDKKFASAVNGAMKNLLAALVEKKELLQSLGDLPRMAQEINVKKDEKVEVVGSESDKDVLNKAAGILNQRDGSQKRPEHLH